MYGDTVTYALSPQKKINFTIAIVFRVPLGISQPPKTSAENPANNHQVGTRNFQ